MYETLMAEPSILCFQHCDVRTKAFCFHFPSVCSICGCDLHSSSTQLLIPPFRLPSPFSDVSKLCCAVVIKPTTGDFLHSYTNSSDLHIGVTNSRGIVYEYKKEGVLNTDSWMWKQCLCVNIVSQMDDQVKRLWDYALESITAEQNWQSFRYDEERHNCYTFVLTFLSSLRLPTLQQHLKSKTNFCQEFIVPQTVVAAKYITLFRRLLTEDVVIQ